MTNEELVALIQGGDHVNDNMAQLYQQNRNFIVTIALPFSRTCELDDLLQEAYFGLEKAVNRYDPDKEVTFLTYAENWIRQTIQRYCQNNGHLKRLPVHIVERISKYQKFRSDFTAATGDEPTDQEYCFHLDLSLDQLKKLRKYMAESTPISLNEDLPGTEDFTLADTIADDFNLEESVVDTVADEEGKAAIWGAVADLGERKAEIVERYYRLGESLDGIGSHFEISTERVRQIKDKCIRTLRKNRKIKEAAEIYGYGSQSAYKWGFGHWKNTNTSSTEFLALKHIEQEKNKAQLYQDATDISSTTALIADHIDKRDGYVPRGIQRLQELNDEIERMLQAERDRRKAVKTHAET